MKLPTSQRFVDFFLLFFLFFLVTRLWFLKSDIAVVFFMYIFKLFEHHRAISFHYIQDKADIYIVQYLQYWVDDSKTF